MLFVLENVVLPLASYCLLRTPVKFRSDWYQIVSAVEDDEDVQKRGFINISYHVRSKTMDPPAIGILRNLHLMADALPIRLAGVHYCYDNPQLRPIALLIQHALGKDSRLRFRAHYGR